MFSTSASTITPVDFHRSTVKPNRWTKGMLRHLVAALGDTPVVMSTERGSGHTMVGITLGRFASTQGVRDGIITGWAFSDGTTQETVARINDITEQIVVLDQPGRTDLGAKWVALRTYGDEASLAIDAAKAAWGEEGVVAWEAIPGEYDVYVRAFTESPYGKTFPATARTGSITLAEVAAAGERRAARQAEHDARWAAERAAH